MRLLLAHYFGLGEKGGKFATATDFQQQNIWLLM